MLKRLDKLAPFLAMLLLGHLTYTALVETSLPADQASRSLTISKEMLHPVLTEPVARASPAGRDPFDVSGTSPPPPPESTSRPASRPTSAPASRPVELDPPPLPKRVAAVIITQHCRMAIIDGVLYKPGSLIGGADPGRCWRVEEIERSRVTLRFGQARRILLISVDIVTLDDPGDGR